MTSTTGRNDLDEIIDRIDVIYAEALATEAEPNRAGEWHHLRDRALGELTMGLPDVDCWVCIAAAPPIPPITDRASAAETPGLVTSWLAASREQLRLGRAVAGSLLRSRDHAAAPARPETRPAGRP
jgi:hypothetical protein